MSTATRAYLDWWADGHFIAAPTAEHAIRETQRLYGHTPEKVRPWTMDDQEGLEEVNGWTVPA